MTVYGTFDIDIAQRSDVGRRRPTNQDMSRVQTVVLPDGRKAIMAAIADGMGGAHAGAEASQLATTTALDSLAAQLQHVIPASDAQWHALLCHAVASANHMVHARSHTLSKGMGTTLLVSVTIERRVYIAHIGDSRAYVVKPARRKPQILQLTADHTVAALLVERGDLSYDDVQHHPQRHQLARSIGPDPAIEPEILARTLRPGERLLLCSDGLPLHVSDSELARTVSDAPSPQAACDQLVNQANQRGGRDNVTVVVLAAERAPTTASA